MENKKIKVCAYCRVSTDSRDQLNSYENQKSYFERELHKNSNYELVGIYADRGISGTKLHRENFNKMLIDAGLDIKEVTNDKGNKQKYVCIESNRATNFNYIFVKNTSRFARNIEVIGILRELRGKKVYVKFLDIDKSSENPDDLTYIEIFMSFDERESIDKSKKVKFGHLESAKNTDKIHTNSKLYGYKYNKIDNSLKIIGTEANVIRVIFNLYVNEGLGIRRIINCLEENNFKTRNNKKFCKSSIERILRNPKYCGQNARLRYERGELFSNRNNHIYFKNSSDWIVNESDKIPAIIDIETYNKAQEIFDTRINKYSQKGKYIGTTEYAGFIRCGSCDEVYTSNTDRGRKFYNCKNKKMNGTKSCTNPNISLKIIEEEILKQCNGGYKQIINFFKDASLFKLDDVRETLMKRIDSDKSNEISKKQAQLSKVYDSLNRLNDLYINELEISKDDYLIRRASIQKKIDNLENEISDLSKGNKEILADIEEVEKIKEIIDNIELKDVYTKEEILNAVDEMYVGLNKNGKVGLTFRYKIEKELNRLMLKYFRNTPQKIGNILF